MEKETKIEDIFVKDIKRSLNPVIKVNDLDDSALYQELDEYVVTKDIDKNFEKLYKAIIKGFAGGGRRTISVSGSQATSAAVNPIF